MEDNSSPQHHTITNKGIPTYEEASTVGSSRRERAWVDPREETQRGTPHDATVELKLIVAYNGKRIRVLEGKLDHNRPFSASIMCYVIINQLHLRPYSE